MKTILSILLTVFLFSSLQAQRNFYHELKGIEDSTGNTHLFFKTKDIHHFNKQTTTDSVLFNGFGMNSLWSCHRDEMPLRGAQKKDRYGMWLTQQATYAKSFNGLRARIIAKVASVTFLQYLNNQNSRPLNHIKHAIAA